VKTFKFLTIFVNLTKDGSVQQFSSQKTITGTDAHLRTAYAVLVKGQISNKNVVAKTFLGDDNKTQEVYGKSQATPAVFSKYFNTTLTMKAVVGIQVGDPVAGPPPQKVWVIFVLWINVAQPTELSVLLQCIESAVRPSYKEPLEFYKFYDGLFR